MIVNHIPELSKFEDKLYEPTIEETKKAYETALQVKKIVLNRIKL